MSGDHAAFTFDPHNTFSGVWQQPGRVSLESDFNEFEEILDRLRRASTYDTVGEAVVPVTTPDGFRLGVDGSGELTIGRGRAYVDGILVECFGDGEEAFDAHLGHEYGTGPLRLADQPFAFPDIPSVSGNTPHLLYLDVWQREVSAYEQESLREPALGGADTTTRVQTAWQVKAIPLPEGQPAQCGTTWEGWDDLTTPSRGRLTVELAAITPDIKPCEVPAKAGYVGLQNRLYRIEIQEGGELGTATFKWSRDNASLVATVTKVVAVGTGSKITVTSTGRDSFQQFKQGQSIELLDDAIEFAMRDTDSSGPIAKITQINDETGEVTVDKDLTGVVDMGGHPRIRRWDTTNDDPTKPVVQPTTPGTAVVLEDGISVTFGPATTSVHAGDFWVFAARTATGEVYPKLNDALPRGILHHYMRLGIVVGGKPPVVTDDCRVMWPTPCDGCGCDFCVTLQSHNSGALTVQDAIDAAIERGGGTVCIGIGTFHLDAGLVVKDAISVRIKGSGVHTTLMGHAQGAALSINDSIGVEVSDLNILTAGERDDDACAVDIADTTIVTLDAVNVLENLDAVDDVMREWDPASSRAPAVRLGGLLARPVIRNCLLAGGTGIGTARRNPEDGGGHGPGLLAVSAVLRDNIIFATRIGIAFDETNSIFAERLAIESNSVFGAREGIVVVGHMAIGAALICQNTVLSGGSGIVVSLDDATVASNAVVGLPVLPTEGFAEFPRRGIYAFGITASGTLRISDNSLRGFAHAVEFEAHVADLTVADNKITDCVGGVLMLEGASSDHVRIVGNTVHTIDGPADEDTFNAAIAVVGSQRAEILHNYVRRPEPRGLRFDFGIAVIGCAQSKITDNVIDDLGAQHDRGATAGIYTPTRVAATEVSGNTVRQILAPDHQSATWLALYGADFSVDGFPWESRLFVTKIDTYWRADSTFVLLLRGGNDVLMTIHGNIFDSDAQSPAVAVVDDTAAVGSPRVRVTFSDNTCRRPGAEDPAVVFGRSEVPLSTLVLNGNQVSAPDPAITVRARVRKGFTVVGNITTAEIDVNGKLAAPWLPLNVKS
jgi:hypothetical protein